MHDNEHGNSVLVVKCTVRVVRDHGEDIEVRPDTLVKQMNNHLHGPCYSPFVGRIRIISTTVTETQMMSAVKTKAKKTNNQASFGCRLLKNNMEVEAAMEMQLHLDETGVHRVCTNTVCEMSGFAPCLTKVCSLKTSLLSVN